MTLQDFFTYILPLIVGVVTWFAGRITGRHKRNNDALADMHKNIDTLVEKYSKTLAEFVEIKKVNANLLIDDKRLCLENEALRGEIKQLREQLSQMKIRVTK